MVNQRFLEWQLLKLEVVKVEVCVFVVGIVLLSQLIREAQEFVQVRGQLIDHAFDIVVHQIFLVDNFRCRV